MVNLYDLDPGPESPEVIRMIVEIPKNSANKYEYDGKLGVFRLDRPLYSPLHYPGDYGFVPGTIADDGDPLDVLTMMSEPSFTGCLIEVRPLGVLDLVDSSERDQKILAVPKSSPRYQEIATVDQVGRICGARSNTSSPSIKNSKASKRASMDGADRSMHAS